MTAFALCAVAIKIVDLVFIIFILLTGLLSIDYTTLRKPHCAGLARIVKHKSARQWAQQ